MYALTASLVLYENDEKIVRKAIDSFLNNRLTTLLFIIDNSPEDKLRSLCTRENIDYCFVGSNKGFGAGHNMAIRKALALRSRYHLVLNPDISFAPGTLERLVAFMDQHPDVGLVMPQILYPDGRPQYLPKLLPTPWSLIKRRLPLPGALRAKLMESYEMRSVDTTTGYECPVISGCFSLFQTLAFEKAGLYDERFFMYFEDFDLSRRIHQSFKTVCYPRVSVFHDYANGARHKLSLFLVFADSAIKYFNKWGWFRDRDRGTMNQEALANAGKPGLS